MQPKFIEWSFVSRQKEVYVFAKEGEQPFWAIFCPVWGNILHSLRRYLSTFIVAPWEPWISDQFDLRMYGKKDICSIQTATGISRCKIYSCFYLGDQKQVRIRLQPRFGLFAKSLMKPYSFVGPGLMHFCSPRTHLLSKAPPTQTPPLSPSNFRQGSRGLVEEMFAICQIYVGCAK